MKLAYRTRRLLSLLILLIGLPIYISLVVVFFALFDRLPLLLELLLYILFGIIWAFPLKFIFQGIGHKDPDS